MLKKYKFNNGFTLLEMIVTLGLFSVVMVISLSSILNIMNVQKKILSTKTIQENLDFAITVMEREIRAGDQYGVNLSNDEFTFRNINLVNITYKTVFNPITGNLELIRDENGSPLALTDPKINILVLDFSLSGEGNNDDAQPMVIINISADIVVDQKSSVIVNVQAAASQRFPDFADAFN